MANRGQVVTDRAQALEAAQERLPPDRVSFVTGDIRDRVLSHVGTGRASAEPGEMVTAQRATAQGSQRAGEHGALHPVPRPWQPLRGSRIAYERPRPG